MTTLLMLLALGAEPADARTSAQPRPYHEINRDLHDALGREARAVDQPDRAAAIVDMADLYVELRRDPRLETSQTLTGYKNRLWSRLTRAKKYLQRELRRDEQSDEESLRRTMLDDATAAAYSDSLTLAGYAAGGPASLVTQAGLGRGGRAVPDTGDELVALIERTIAPERWEANGGPCTIYYYRPLRVLVVRANSEVHGRLGGVIGDLRAAGK